MMKIYGEVAEVQKHDGFTRYERGATDQEGQVDQHQRSQGRG